MVQSTALTVVDYFLGLAPDRIATICRLREECRARLTDWDERMQWGMPGYGPPGSDALISFNSQKNHISVYIGKAAIDDHKALVTGATFGKGCVRYRHADQIDFDVLGRMLSASFLAKSSRP